ncbi:type II toxin-antitoxin system RelE/ParE family toxin [Limosilactobacillus sp.]|jgi:plasmid stabilization system protein ParE|uniref:type II toxin-antitoxin system RelE/ParE family toxin n=1 Tax=Limosilactobacillus sp. TaxID=2773925 RepID=UPI0025BCE335|nr:type II toxin-antitoxin system RelE/ParE family toxin [Limosilactobacillus sp.]MCI2031495.1 type II toxin-antitoxin system RelE/ParE family toxin [Limosilactobacillus sp.]
MKIKYTPGFADSLEQTILYWQDELKLSPTKIHQFTAHLNKKIKLIGVYPGIGTDVTELYGFKEQTYRTLIGHSYGIFYRLDQANNQITIGAIFNTAEMKVKF